MKHLLTKRNLTIFGAGGGKPQPPPPPIITLYPAVITPPLLGDTEQLTTFSYAEMIDLISDGPIEGLVNKNGNKLYDENIFEGIYLNDAAVKETSKLKTQSISIAPIKEGLKTLWQDSDEDVVKIIPNDVKKISQSFNFDILNTYGVKRFPSPILIESYHPDVSITKFIEKTNADFDLIGSIERAFNSSPISTEKPFLTVITIPKILINLDVDKFDELEDPRFPMSLSIPNLGNHIYFSISSSSLNSFNYFEMPRSFAFNEMKTSSGKRTFLKNRLFNYSSNSNFNYGLYEILNVKIFIWSIYSSEYGIKKIGNILDKYFNNLFISQNSQSLYNYNLVQSEFKNGNEFQFPLQNFQNIHIENDYNKELVGPFKLKYSSSLATDGKCSCGVIRVQNVCSAESQYPSILTDESSDDIRYVKRWPVEYTKQGYPSLMCNFYFNYSIFDKNSLNRTCQDAQPVTHYIVNQNVEQVYLTINVNALSDTNHIDLVSADIGTKGAQTNAPYFGAKTYKEIISPTPLLGSTQSSKTLSLLVLVDNTSNECYVIGGTKTDLLLTSESTIIPNLRDKKESYYKAVSSIDGFGSLPNFQPSWLYPYDLSSDTFLSNYLIPNNVDPILTPSFKITEDLTAKDWESKLKTFKSDGTPFYSFGLLENEYFKSTSGRSMSRYQNIYYKLNSNQYIYNIFINYTTISDNNVSEKYIVATKINSFINWRAIFNGVSSDGTKVNFDFTYKFDQNQYLSIKRHVVDNLLNNSTNWNTLGANFSNLNNLYAIGLTKDYFLNRTDIWEIDPVNNASYFSLSFLNNLIEDYVPKYNENTRGILVTEKSNLTTISNTKGIENIIKNYANGNLILDSSIFSVSYATLQNLSFFENKVFIDGSLYTKDLYILYPDASLLSSSDNDIVIRYAMYNTSLSNTANVFQSSYKPSVATETERGPDASNVKQAISAGTKLPAVISFEIETGYESLEQGNCYGTQSFFKYQYDIYGISNGDALMDIGRKKYTNIQTQKSISLSNSDEIIKINTFKNIYFYKVSKVLNGSLSGTKYFISDARREDNIKSNIVLKEIDYNSSIKDSGPNNHVVNKSPDALIAISPFSPYSSENSIGYGSLIFDKPSTTLKSNLSIGASASFNLNSTDFTIEFWIYPTSFASTNSTRLLTFGVTPSSSSFVVQFSSNGAMTFGVVNTGSAQYVSSSSTLDLKKWQHFAFTFTSAGIAKLYKNGVAVASSTTTARTTPASNNNVLYIGYDPNGSAALAAEQFVGFLTDLRITKSIVYSQDFNWPTGPLANLASTGLLLNNNIGSGDSAVYKLDLTDNFGTFFGTKRNISTTSVLVSNEVNEEYSSRIDNLQQSFIEITESQFNSFVQNKNLDLFNSLEFLKQNNFLKQYASPVNYIIASKSVDTSINSLGVDSYRNEFLFSPNTNSLNFVQTDIFSYEFEFYESFEINSSKKVLIESNPITETGVYFVAYFEYAKNSEKNLRKVFKEKNIDVLEIEIFRYLEPQSGHISDSRYYGKFHNLTLYIRALESNRQDVNDIFLNTSFNYFSKTADVSDIFSTNIPRLIPTPIFGDNLGKPYDGTLSYNSPSLQNYYEKLNLTNQTAKITEYLNKLRRPYSKKIVDPLELIEKFKFIRLTSLYTIYDSVPIAGPKSFNVLETNMFQIPFVDVTNTSLTLTNSNLTLNRVGVWTLHNKNTNKFSIIINKPNSSNSFSDLKNLQTIEYIELTQFLTGFVNNYKLFINRDINKLYSNNKTCNFCLPTLGTETLTYGENKGTFWTEWCKSEREVSYAVDFPDGFICGNWPVTPATTPQHTRDFYIRDCIATDGGGYRPISNERFYNMYALNFKNNFEGNSSAVANKKLTILSKIKEDNETHVDAILSLLKNKTYLGNNAFPEDVFSSTYNIAPLMKTTWTSQEHPSRTYCNLYRGGIIPVHYKTREGLKPQSLPPEILDISYYELNLTNSPILSDGYATINQLENQIVIPPPRYKENGETLRRYVKVTRLSHETLSPLIQKRITLQKVTEIIPQNFSYPFSAMVGTKIDSRAFSQIPTRTFHCKLKKVLVPSNYFIEDPETGLDIRYQKEKIGTKIYEDNWDGSFKLAWTNNPAWILMDLLINKRYGLGIYIESEQIDIWELYKIARWCDGVDENGKVVGIQNGYGGIEPRHAFNGVIEEKYNLFEIVNQVASVFRGNVYYMNSMITFDDDRPKPPAGEFTNADVKDGIFNYTNMRKDEEFTALDIAFIDETNDYRPSIEYVEDSDAIRKRGVLKRNINAFGITSRSQARRFGKHILYHTAKEKLNISFTTDVKALMFKPGDIIQIHDELLTTYKNYGRVLEIKDVDENYFNIKIDQAINSGIYSINEISLHTPTTKLKREDINNLLKRDVFDKIQICETSLLKNFIFSHLTGYYAIAPNSSSYQVDAYGRDYVIEGIDVTTLKSIIQANNRGVFTNGIGIDNIGLGATLNIPDFNLYRDFNSSDSFPEYTGTLNFNFKSVNKNSIVKTPDEASNYREYQINSGLNVFLRYNNGYIANKNLTGFWSLSFDSDFLTGKSLFLDSTKSSSRLYYDKYFFKEFDSVVSDAESFQKQYLLPANSNLYGNIEFEILSKNKDVISYADIIENDKPTIETFSIFSYETGVYQVTGNLLNESGEIPTEYTEIILNKTGINGLKKESVMYNLNTITTGSAYSLNLIDKEKFIFKINSITENYINEYSILATQYSETKFKEIEEDVSYDNIEDTFNQLYYYSRSSNTFDPDRNLQSPIISNVSRYNKPDGKGFGLLIEWQMSYYNLDQVKYKIFIQTPSKQTKNIQITSDFTAYNKTLNTFTLNWEGNGEVGTYKISIYAYIEENEIYTSSVENSKSVTILDY